MEASGGHYDLMLVAMWATAYRGLEQKQRDRLGVL